MLPTNVFPAQHFTGRGLTSADGARYKLIGSALNETFRPIHIGYTGDWAWQKQEFNLPFSYANMPNHICNTCHAVGRAGPCSAWDVRDDAEWLGQPRDGSVDWAHDQPLLRVSSAHRDSIFEEVVHEDCLGCRPIITGGAMVP